LKGPPFSAKTTSFNVAVKKLKEYGFDNLTAFELIVLRHGGTDVVRDVLSSASFAASNCSAIVQTSAAISTLDQPTFHTLTEDCISRLQPEYGYGFNMPHASGPGFYAVGINYCAQSRGISKDEIHRISRWGNEGIPNSVWKEGLLRDVYQLNVVDELHLRKHVDEHPLREWILRDANRGRLYSTNDLSIWTVAEAQVDHIRNVLANARMLFR
jgi:hypothetical protein